MRDPEVFLGLGSNVGEREATLERALELLEQRGLRITARSSLYLTEPVGGPPQGWFVNAAAAADTGLGPEAVLAACLDVERALGRVRSEKNAPRTLDVDLLFHGDEVRSGPGLVLPHPRLHERLFVLVPLEEIAPGLRHPVLGLTVSELRRRCPDPSKVVLHARAAERP